MKYILESISPSSHTHTRIIYAFMCRHVLYTRVDTCAYTCLIHAYRHNVCLSMYIALPDSWEDKMECSGKNLAQ